MNRGGDGGVRDLNPDVRGDSDFGHVAAIALVADRIGNGTF